MKKRIKEIFFLCKEHMICMCIVMAVFLFGTCSILVRASELETTSNQSDLSLRWTDNSTRSNLLEVAKEDNLSVTMEVSYTAPDSGAQVGEVQIRIPKRVLTDSGEETVSMSISTEETGSTGLNYVEDGDEYVIRNFKILDGYSESSVRVTYSSSTATIGTRSIDASLGSKRSSLFLNVVNGEDVFHTLTIKSIRDQSTVGLKYKNVNVDLKYQLSIKDSNNAPYNGSLSYSDTIGPLVFDEKESNVVDGNVTISEKSDYELLMLYHFS